MLEFKFGVSEGSHCRIQTFIFIKVLKTSLQVQQEKKCYLTFAMQKFKINFFAVQEELSPCVLMKFLNFKKRLDSFHFTPVIV